MQDILLKNGTLVTDAGESKSDVFIESGLIKSIESSIKESDDVEVVDATGLLIMPGLIDCHVHFREPGLTHKSTMKSESASALAGGVTTVCEMPNTVPPTVSVDAFAEKVRLAKNLPIDIRFFFGATQESHLEDLRKLFREKENAELRARCSGLKLYFDHSTGNQGADAKLIEKAFALCADLGIVAVCHCEDAAMNAAAAKKFPKFTDVAMHSLMRPPEAEVKAVEQAIGFARKYGTRFHVAHLSTAGALDLVRNAKEEELLVTCEIAPHHLFFSADDYAALGNFGKMNPPLRALEDTEALWAGIAEGVVDCIATDHAPHTLEEKKNADLTKVPSGVPGVETMLPLLLTAMGDELLSSSDILRLCFTNPNEIFGLGKAGLTEDAPADLILIDPLAEWTVTGKALKSACGWTPYEGQEMQGRVVRVIR